MLRSSISVHDIKVHILIFLESYRQSTDLSGSDLFPSLLKRTKLIKSNKILLDIPFHFVGGKLACSTYEVEMGEDFKGGMKKAVKIKCMPQLRPLLKGLF